MRLGIDLGGTKIEIVALGDDGVVLTRERVPTPAGDYAGTIRAIRDLVAGVEARLNCRGSVGIATPGALSTQAEVLKNSNSTVLNGKPIKHDLEAALGRPVRMENDANCLALSEAADGAAAGASIVFGVILGTGVGGGLVVDRTVVTGRNRIAGEWGHNPLPWITLDEYPGPPCYCGKKGCIETFLSGPGFEQDFAAATGRRLAARAIVDAASAGEPAARDALARYHDRLARALASVINLLDPEVVVLGGGMSNTPGLAPAVSERLPSYVFSGTVETRVVGNTHGDSSGVRGAAWLWPL